MPNIELAKLMFLGMIWGASFMLMRISVVEFGVWAMVEIRALLATLVLLPFVIYKKQIKDMLRYWQPITVIGLTNTAIPFCLFGYGSIHLPAALTSLLNGTAPLFGALLAWLWLRDRISHLAKLGFLCGFVGVYLLSYDALSFQGVSLLPVFACLGATFCYGWAICYMKKHLQGVKPLAIAMGSQAVSALVLMPLVLLYPPAVLPSIEAWTAVLLLAAVCTGVAYILYFDLIMKVGPGKALYVGYLVPLFGLIWGAMLLNEVITPIMIVGGSVILFGIALTSGLIGSKKIT